MRFLFCTILIFLLLSSYYISSCIIWERWCITEYWRQQQMRSSYLRFRHLSRNTKERQSVSFLSQEDSEMKRADISCGDAYPMYSPSLLGLWKNRVLWLLLWVAHSLPHGAHSSQTNWYRQREAVFPFISTECGEDEQSLFISGWYS